MPDLAARGFELSHPLFLLLGLFAPLVFHQAHRLPASVTFSSLTIVATRHRSLRARLLWLPAALLALATLCIAVALAGPRTGDAVTEVKHEGIAIAMARWRRGTSCAATPAPAASTS